MLIFTDAQQHPKTQKQNLKWWVVQCFDIKQHTINLRSNKCLLFMSSLCPEAVTQLFSWVTASWSRSSTAWEKHFLPGGVAPVNCARRHLIFSRKISNHIIKPFVPSWLVLVQGNGHKQGHNWLLFWSRPSVSGNSQRTANISTLSTACRLPNTSTCKQ